MSDPKEEEATDTPKSKRSTANGSSKTASEADTGDAEEARDAADTGEADGERAGADPSDADAPEANDADAEANDAEASDADADETDEEEGENVLPRGNPLRVRRGLVAILGGGLPAFLLMAKSGQLRVGVPLGVLCSLVCVWGVLDLLGTFDDAEENVAGQVTAATLRGPLLRVASLLVAFMGSLAAAQASWGPWWTGPVFVTASFIGLVVTVFELGRALGPWATDEDGRERPIVQRHGFWVVALGGLLYFPAMGLQSLWDPWETHYGEVAREILSRDDWISLWWAQDGWFWSKPILNFWIQSLSMASLGTGYHPDQMLIGVGGATAHPEWVVRTPNVLMTLVAMYLIYKGVAKVFGRRAGFLGAIVLATMPDWFFLAHQTMTDMPFVSAMTGAMGLLLYGLNTPEEERVKLWEVRAFGHTWRLSLFHLVFGVILLCAVPQILYLLSRNLELILSGDGPKGFRVHWDEFRAGSGGGNCGLPGNQLCSLTPPASIPKSVPASPEGLVDGLKRYFGAFEPSLQAIVWSLVLGGLLYLNWGERRVRRLVYVGAWLCAALATMAKGPAGFALPMICACAYIATKKRWSELLRLELLSGLLVILCVAIPWYVAMYVRHGSPFTDRLIFHDMFNRAFSHVHDTNEGDDTGIRYYIWQLGYATFPWTGLVPLGLLWWTRRSDSAERTRADGGVAGAHTGDASVLLAMWFLFAYALFTFMGTKFHHYIFPAIAPAAMLVGVVLDDILGRTPFVKPGRLGTYIGGLASAAAIAVFGASRLWQGSLFGEANGPEASLALGVVILVVGAVAAFVVVKRFGEASPADTEEEDEGAAASPRERRATHEALMIGGATLAGAGLVALVGRDLSHVAPGDQPGAIRLLQLFTYNYRRQWPDTLDFSAILAGFTLVAVVVSIALAFRRARRHATVLFAGLAFVWALWGVNVYMPKLSPHWGQHEVMQAYYANRKDGSEQLVAYQMNWKGENFYTGNRIPAFVSTGSTFKAWLATEKTKGASVMYFVTEHSRIGGLKNEVGAKAYKEVTDRALCNKFVLVRAEL